MKIRVTMKDPDVLNDAIEEAVTTDLEKTEGLDDQDRAAIFKHRIATVMEIAAKWFKYGEYVTIEIDTETKTATVLPNGSSG